MPDRPDPDELLAKIEQEQAKAKRGRLKIFFGSAAGLGKIYAMLLAARERRSENIDVFIHFYLKEQLSEPSRNDLPSQSAFA